MATAPLVSHTFGIVPLAGVVVNPAAILLGSIVVLAGALWMLLPFGWRAPAFECVLSHTAERLNALARVHGGSVLAHSGGIHPRRRGDGGRLPVFSRSQRLTAWSSEPKKSVHLPA